MDTKFPKDCVFIHANSGERLYPQSIGSDHKGIYIELSINQATAIDIRCFDTELLEECIYLPTGEILEPILKNEFLEEGFVYVRSFPQKNRQWRCDLCDWSYGAWSHPDELWKQLPSHLWPLALCPACYQSNIPK